MKKLLMSLVLLPLMALADAEKVGDVTWSYRVSSEKVTVKGANPCAGKLEIPQTLGGYPVSGISPAAFFGCEDLTEMVIPEGVAEIGAAAFCDCIGLTSVTIPSTMVSIADAAFEGCDSLTTIHVSAGDTVGVKAMIVDSDSGIDIDSLTFVERLADGGPYKETVNGIEWTFVISEGRSILENHSVFEWGGDLYESVIPGGTTGALVIPSTLGDCPVTSIGRNAFVNCSGLTSVVIPSSVTSIGEARSFGAAG